MAHYDCSDCGASMGIGYGYCTECTPKEVFEADRALKEARKRAEREWEISQSNLRFQMQIEQLEKERNAVKDRFIESEVGELRQRYKTLYDKHNPRNRS